MSELTKRAAKAAIAGWTLGSPREGRTEYVRMTGYDPIPVRMVTSHPLDAWLAWSKHLDENRPPQLLARTVDEHLRLTTEESAYGYLNILKGFTSPLSGAHANPRANGSEAILRAAFWGLAFHGNADKAAEYAFYDASLDHAEEGIWIPAAVAAAVATATPSTSVSQVAEAFTDALPSDSKLNKLLPEIQKTVGNSEGPREFRRRILNLTQNPDQLDAVPSGAYILLGLLNSKADPGTGMLITAGCGGASSHNAAVTGILTTLIAENLAEEWIQPLGKNYITSFVLKNLDPPTTVEEFADRIGAHHIKPELIQLAPQPAEESEEPSETETKAEAKSTTPEEDSAEPTEDIKPITEAEETTETITVETSEPAEPMWPIALSVQPDTKKLLTQQPFVTYQETADLMIKVRYMDSPLALPNFSTQAQVVFTNTTEESKNVELSVMSPEDWQVATRMTAARLDPNTPVDFPVVLQPKSNKAAQEARWYLEIDGVQTVVPLAKPQPWRVVGPFANADGMGYEHAYRPENNLDFDEVMNGRSNMGIRWQTEWLPGHVFDLEPLFKSGPGVVYLYAEIELPKSGPYTLMAAFGGGIKVWIDGQRTLAYYDHHTPVPTPEGRYAAHFTAGSTVKVLVKLLRDKDPAKPLSLAFFDEDGNLTQPVRFH